MQTQTKTHKRTVSKRAWSGPVKGKTGLINRARSKRASKAALSSWSDLGPGILNYEFPAIISETNRDSLFSEIDVDGEKSCKQLYDSALNYMHLLGNESIIPLTGNKYEDIIIIYNALKSALPGGQKLNIDDYKKELSFEIYDECEGFPEVFTFLPVNAVQRMSTSMADLFLEFVKFYASSQGILGHSDHGDIDYILEEYIPQELEGWKEEGHDKDGRANFEKYLSGYIPELFKAIESISTTSEILLQKCLDIRSSVTGTDLILLDVIIEGIPLLDSDSITRYSYSDNFDDEQEYDCDEVTPVEFDRTFAIIWDSKDWFCDCLEEWINNDINEFGCQGATSWNIILPETTKLFTLSEYPVKFYEWYCKLYETLELYELNN
jgi:hypothetical protein